MKHFEIYLIDQKIIGQYWRQFEEKITQYDKQIAFEILFNANNIEFYLLSNKDLSGISTKIENFLLVPSEIKSQDIPHKSLGLKFRSISKLLEFKEKEEINHARNVHKIRITMLNFFLFRVYQISVYYHDIRSHYSFITYSFNNPLHYLELDYKKNAKYKKRAPPLFLKIDKTIPLFSQEKNSGFLEIKGFPYFSNPVYFPLGNFEINKHTLVVGQTGVGKSKFIELFIKEMVRSGLSDKYRVIIIDPHAVLYTNFLDIKNNINIDFVKSSCNLFPASCEPKIATELTILLFKTLLEDQFGAKMERVLKYILYILFLQNNMSLQNLKSFLTELEFRKEILSGIDEQYDYLVHFFDTEFIEIQTKFYEVAIMPLLVLVDELNFIPALNRESQNDLENIISNNFLTVFSLNRIFLGEKATRLIAGLLIQQIFLTAQKQKLNKKLILIIDEVSLVENKSMISILSEARKFNLSLFLSQQYLTQVSSELLQATLSNIYNYFVFKVSDEDASILSKNLQVEFTDEVLKNAKEKGLSENDLKKNVLVSLNFRECLARIFYKSQFYPCFKGKTITI